MPITLVTILIHRGPDGRFCKPPKREAVAEMSHWVRFIRSALKG